MATFGPGKVIDLVASYGLDPTGVVDATTAWQRAIDENTTGAVFLAFGTFKVGNLVWPGTAAAAFSLYGAGTINLTAGATFTIQPYLAVRGLGPTYSDQFGYSAGCWLINPSSTSDPAVLMYGGPEVSLENVRIAGPHFTGLKIINNISSVGGLAYLKNVSCRALQGNMNSIPFVSDSFFWIDMDNCVFIGDSSVSNSLAWAGGTVTATMALSHNLRDPATFTGTIAPLGTGTGTLTVSALSRALVPGEVITVGATAGTVIVNQLTATTYTVSPSQTVGPVSMTANQTVNIAGATPTGFNGVYPATPTGASTFTYPLAGDPGTLAVSTITFLSANRALMTTSVAHGLSGTFQTLVSGSSVSSYNGLWSGTYVPPTNGSFPAGTTVILTLTGVPTDPGAGAGGTYQSQANISGALASNFPVQFLQNQSNAVVPYSGLVTCRNLRLNSGGIYISATTAPFSNSFEFYGPQIENAVTGTSLLTIDSTYATGLIGQIELFNPKTFDQTGNIYFLKNTGANTRDVKIRGTPVGSTLWDPASTNIACIDLELDSEFPYTSPIKPVIVPSTAGSYNIWFNGGGVDAQLLTQNRGPQVLPGTPLPVEQDVSTWGALVSGGATVVTGLIAPDGSLTAAMVTGTNNGFVNLNNVSTYTSAAGDWFIACCWVRGATSAELVAAGITPNTFPTFSNPAITGDGGRPVFPIISPSTGLINLINQGLLGSEFPPIRRGENEWVLLRQAFKLTTVQTNPAKMAMHLLRSTTYNYTVYWMPGIIRIPAGTMPDAEVRTLSRTLQPWPSTALQGDVPLLTGQKFMLAGGTKIFSQSAIPTTGAHVVGEVCYNSVPSVGQPKGWMCTVAGTPGTWVSMGNL